MESSREKGGGGGGYSIKLCSERFRPEVQSLILIYITFWTKGTTFVKLPLKNCTLFTYLLEENKSVRKEVSQSLSCKLSLNLHVNNIAIRRVYSRHFDKRPFKILNEQFSSPFTYFNLWFPYPLLHLMLEIVTLRAKHSGLWKVHHELTGDEWTLGHGRWLKTGAIIDNTIKSP